MKKKKVTEKENERKDVLQAEIANVKKEIEAIDKGYIVAESNVTPDSYNPTTTKGSDFDIDKDWEKELSEFLKNNPVKQKRVKFYNTYSSYWQFIPAVAVDLIFKQVDISWLCFGISISFERNG